MKIYFFFIFVVVVVAALLAFGVAILAGALLVFGIGVVLVAGALVAAKLAVDPPTRVPATTSATIALFILFLSVG